MSVNHTTPGVVRPDGSIDPQRLVAWLAARSPASALTIAQQLRQPVEAVRPVLAQLCDAGQLIRLDGRWQVDATAAPPELGASADAASDLPEITSEAQRALLIQIALHPGASRTELAGLAKVPRNTVSSALSRLRDLGVVTGTGQPLQLSPLGARWLHAIGQQSVDPVAEPAPRGSRGGSGSRTPVASAVDRRAELWDTIQDWSLKTRGLSVLELEALFQRVAPLLGVS